MKLSGIRFLFAPALALAIGLSSISGAAAGVGGPAFYVDGVPDRTVGTPTDFSHTGAEPQL